MSSFPYSTLENLGVGRSAHSEIASRVGTGRWDWHCLQKLLGGNNLKVTPGADAAQPSVSITSTSRGCGTKVLMEGEARTFEGAARPCCDTNSKSWLSGFDPGPSGPGRTHSRSHQGLTMSLGVPCVPAEEVLSPHQDLTMSSVSLQKTLRAMSWFDHVLFVSCQGVTMSLSVPSKAAGV